VQNLVVMKFGGTSMGSPDSLQVVASLSRREFAIRPTVVAVSAMSKVTDMLLETMYRAERGDENGVRENLTRLADRHAETCASTIHPERQEETTEAITALLARFERIVNGMMMLRERPPRALDEALTIGELLSATMLVQMLEGQGQHAALVPGYDVIVTDPVHGNATPRMELTSFKCKEVLLPMVEAGTLPVVTGFCGATEQGVITTLGRGGSDFTATILAAGLDAREVWIWTDVDGIMTADPRMVPEARVLSEITYNEAAELAYNGAKVLHPRTLLPLAPRGIPLWSKNTFNPEFPGTQIVARSDEKHGARAVTSSTNVVLVNVEPASPAVNPSLLMAKCLEAMARVNAEVLTFSSSSYRQSFCFLVRRSELADAMRSVESVLALEINHGYIRPIEANDDVGLLAVVGEGMKGEPGLAGRVFTAISNQNVNIIAISQGSSELTIAIVVRREDVEMAVRAVHAECGLAMPR
jgi:bifunctional aspartokinase / homoserine dehydrogenase 1